MTKEEQNKKASDEEFLDPEEDTQDSAEEWNDNEEEENPVPDEARDPYAMDVDRVLDAEISKGQPSKPEKIEKANLLGFEVPADNQTGVQRTI